MSLGRPTLLVAVLGGFLLAAPPVVAAPTPASTCFDRTATILGTDEPEIVNGTPGDDVIVAGDGNDTIDGMGGNDRICAGNGDGQRASDQFDDDVVKGGDGVDMINGGFGNDTIEGLGGNDTLLGDDGGEPAGETNFISTSDKIFGGNGDDTLTGRGDQDILRGEDGNDTIESRDASPPTGSGSTGGPPGPPGSFNIDVVLGGNGTDECNADAEDDVSECENVPTPGENRESNDPLEPNNSFGTSASARRPGSSDSSGGGGSSGGSSSDPSAGNFFFGTFGTLSRRCLPEPPLVGKRGISAFRLGERTTRSVLRPLVIPLSSRSGRFVYCNQGGGQTFLLSSRGRVRLLATTAETKRTRGIAPGDRLSTLLRQYADAARIGPGLYRGADSSPVFFGVRRGRVSFVGVSPRALFADPADLARAVRLLRPGR